MNEVVRAVSLWKMVACSIVLAAAAGCVIPTPGSLDEGSARANIARDVVEFLKPLQTTRADVVLRLGNPTERLAGDRFFIYDWATVDVIWAFCAEGGCIGGPLARTAHFLGFEFDPENRVVEVRKFEADTVGDARKQMLEWIATEDSPPADVPEPTGLCDNVPSPYGHRLNEPEAFTCARHD